MRSSAALLTLCFVAFSPAAHAQAPSGESGGSKPSSEEDALMLQAEEPDASVTKPPKSIDGPTAVDGRSTVQPVLQSGRQRVYVEGALGRIDRRYGLDSQDARRFSLDYSQSWQPTPGWRIALSNRYDNLHPVEDGLSSSINSLREAYASWQDPAGSWVMEAGRINLRNGPAYGFNPTDYLREDALRAITSPDPLALRENRLGTVMLRAQRLWSGGSMSLALAPKLADERSDSSFSLDLGATNRHNRALLSWSQSWGERINSQLLAYSEAGRAPQFGINGTWLLSDAIVAHGEFSRGTEADRLAQVLGVQTVGHRRNRVSAGLTYTTPTRLALTLEYQYNGAAPDRAQWDSFAPVVGVNGLGAYVLDAQRRQDSTSRNAWLLYAQQKSLIWKNLDLAGFVRHNSEDHSHIGWLELRWHFDRVDLAAQWLQSHGNSTSENGLVPNRRMLQVVAAYYF